jgi:hypothetical protein
MRTHVVAVVTKGRMTLGRPSTVNAGREHRECGQETTVKPGSDYRETGQNSTANYRETGQKKGLQLRENTSFSAA